jgi:hypothetical protein
VPIAKGSEPGGSAAPVAAATAPAAVSQPAAPVAAAAPQPEPQASHHSGGFDAGPADSADG